MFQGGNFAVTECIAWDNLCVSPAMKIFSSRQCWLLTQLEKRTLYGLRHHRLICSSLDRFSLQSPNESSLPATQWRLRNLRICAF